jgi:hypothetical protein
MDDDNDDFVIQCKKSVISWRSNISCSSDMPSYFLCPEKFVVKEGMLDKAC